METVVLVIHLLLALAIIALVLMQRSSGGGLGIGGGGMGDFASARGTANVMTKATTYMAIAFFGTSLTLAYLAGESNEDNVLDALGTPEAAIELPIDVEPAQPEVPVGE